MRRTTKRRAKRDCKRRLRDDGIDSQVEIDRVVFVCNAVESDYPLVKWRKWTFGTVRGQWRHVPDAVEILAILNRTPGNGDFVKAIQAIERRAEADRKSVRVRSFSNAGLKEWFIRRGYTPGVSTADGTDFVECDFS